MKIRELSLRAGSRPVPIWPPVWVTSFGPGDKMAIGSDGVLESVERLETRLRLGMKYAGREYMGILQWDPPPALGAVETILRDQIGHEIRAIGDLDI